MKYHYENKEYQKLLYGFVHGCDHPIYDKCTLFKIDDRGLAVIQQRFNKKEKKTWWGPIDSALANDIFLNQNFYDYFMRMSETDKGDIYPTVTVRQIMWALRMKPLPKERWETVFDRKFI